MAGYSLNGDVSDVIFNSVACIHNIKTGRLFASKILLETKGCHDYANVEYFVDKKLRELLLLLNQTGQLDLIKVTPKICVPGLACITISDFESNTDDHEKKPGDTCTTQDIELFLCKLKQAFSQAHHSNALERHEEPA